MPSSSDYILTKKQCAIQGCGCNSNSHHEHNHPAPPCILPGPCGSQNSTSCIVGPTGPTGPPGSSGGSSSLNITNNISTDMEYFPVFSPTYNGSYNPYTSNTKYMYNPANGNLMTHGTYVPADQTTINTITPLDPDHISHFLHKLQPVSYKINGQSPGPIHYGFVAQDVETAMNGQNLALIYHTRSNKSTIALNELIAPLVASVNSLSKKVTELTERIEKIENTTYKCNRKEYCHSCSK